MKRRWLLAVVVSTLFHVALIAGFRALLERAHTADLAANPPPPPALHVAAPPPGPKFVEIIRIGLREAPRVAPAPARAPRIGPSQPRAEEPSGVAGEVASPDDSRAEPVSQVAATAVAPPLEAPKGPSAEVIALVHARLAQGAARCYPAAAQRFKQQGLVLVAFCAGPSGTIEHITVDTGSGSSLLDHAASDCVVPSANPLPFEAAGACFRLPVRFGQ